MPYVENGRVVNKRSPWRLQYYIDLIKGIINFIIFFFLSLIDPKAAQKYKGNNPSRGGRRPDDDFGGGGGGRGGPSRPRARIAGMSSLEGTGGHAAACGGGG
eukprot:TRINITY_DN5571_c0_g1_i1.p2 TRINITY_DN5571_c0_g1~~TRINITY_DN5571_c0_g1_i1.p2  ORF type:complete len:102 (-),score=22.49 TRINITY_DN5571_c0_g1_i1:486-791(-)